MDNLNWIFNLSSKALLTVSKPIIEENYVTNKSLDLKLARKMAKNKGLISYEEESDDIKVYVRVYYGFQKWELNI